MKPPNLSHFQESSNLLRDAIALSRAPGDHDKSGPRCCSLAAPGPGREAIAASRLITRLGHSCVKKTPDAGGLHLRSLLGSQQYRVFETARTCGVGGDLP